MSCQHIAFNLSHSERVSMTSPTQTCCLFVCSGSIQLVTNVVTCLFTEGGVVAKVLLLIWLVFTLPYQGG